MTRRQPLAIVVVKVAVSVVLALLVLLDGSWFVTGLAAGWVGAAGIYSWPVRPDDA